MGIRAGDLPPLSGATLGRVGPAPCLGITIEETLLVEMQVKLGVWESCLYYYMSCSGKGRGEMPLPLTPYNLKQIMELTFSLTICSTQEIGSCSSPEKHSRADFVGKGDGENLQKV